MNRHATKLLNWTAAAVFVAVVAACGGQSPVEQATLSVTIAGNGTGTVVSDPAGIDFASGTDTADFTAGTEVELTATATGGSTFAGWSGACSGTDPCTVTLDDDTNVTATFTAPVGEDEYTVTVTAAGAGDGSVASDVAGFGLDVGDTEASTVVDAGTVVNLTATAEDGSIFAGWSGGGCSGTAGCQVTVNADTDVVATFVLEGDAVVASFNILTGADDAEEYLDAVNNANPSFPAGSVDLTSSDLDLTWDTADVFGTTTDRARVAVGLRYGNVSIPAGSVVTSATITFTRVGSSGSGLILLIEGEAADDAEAFAYNIVTPNNFNITSRTRTTATVDWAPADLTTPEVVTSDVSAILQEIVDRAGWEAGNALAFIVTSENSTSSRVLRTRSFEGGAAPVLSVTYEAPAAP